MAKISEDKRKEIILTYDRIGTYSGTAKEVGVSASTVKKYVQLALASETISIDLTPIDLEQVQKRVETFVLDNFACTLLVPSDEDLF